MKVPSIYSIKLIEDKVRVEIQENNTIISSIYLDIEDFYRLSEQELLEVLALRTLMYTKSFKKLIGKELPEISQNDFKPTVL